MTREEKIKAIILVAEGKKSPGRSDETIIWGEWEKGVYKAGINGKEVTLNEKQFKYYKKKLGGIHIVLRFCDAEDREPEQPRVIIPEPIVTEETTAEIVMTPAVTTEPVTISGNRPTYNDINFEELDWIDSPITERISYMFPKRR